MFTVECPGCKAAYQVDERRVPATGLRMRCPKCSTAFVVEKPAAVTPTGAEALAAPPAPKAEGRGPQGQLGPGVATRPLPPRTLGQASALGPPRSPLLAPAPPIPAKPGIGTGGSPRGSHSLATDLPAVGAKPPPQRQPTVDTKATPPLGVRPKPPLRHPSASMEDDLLPQPARQPDRQPNSQLGAQSPAAFVPPRTGVASPAATATKPTNPDVPGQVAKATAHQKRDLSQIAGSEHEDLPTVRQLGDLPAVLESDLPAALGTPRGPNKARGDEATPSGLAPDKKPRPFDNLDMDLPGMLSSEGEDPMLPDVSNLLPQASPALELDLPSPASVSPPAMPIKTTSKPPELDDFEFELPSPLQAQKGYPEFDSGPATGNQRPGNVADSFDLPDLQCNLPVVRAATDGLPSVPGRSNTSKKTLSGTGSSVAPAADDRGRPRDAAPMEVDLGLDFDLVSDRGSDSRPAAQFGAPAASLPPALGGPSPGPHTGFGPSTSEMELPVEPASFPPKRQAVSSVPPPMADKGQGLTDGGVGGTDYGEVSLESAGHDLSVETESEVNRHSLSGDVLEFGGVPQAVEAPVAGSPPGDVAGETPTKGDVPAVRKSSSRERVAGATTSKRARMMIAASVIVVAVTGSALTLAPDVGPFGAHFVADQVGRKQNDALVRRQVDAGREVLVADDFSGVVRVLTRLESVCRDHERLRSLKAYAAYFAYATELRHGSQPQSRARAKVILDELGDRSDLTYLGLAGAARAAVEGNLAKARRGITAEISRDPRSVDAQVISAEISMLEHRPTDALQTWQLVAKLEPSARAAFGLARAHFALGQFEAAAANADETMTHNPGHVGARLLLARIALAKQGDTELAQRRITEALGLEAQQSVADFVLGMTLTGDLHLLRSHISQAEAAYQHALSKDPRCAPALRGLGETLYRAGRYSESLARYEAGLQADPDDVLVAVGAAKAQLALERVREAETLLARLRQANPKNYAVNYWYAKVEEAAGNREEAEKAYAVAIEAGGTEPIVVDAYVSMALLKNQQGRREEAQKVLTIAQEKLPRMPKIHEAIGQLALSEGRYASAVEQFKLAIALDPNDIGIKFRLGVALRKNRDFDAASKIFDEVTAVDRDYPGLALERGQLYEASGQTEEALRAFESALAKAPTDPDLMLRVGCGKVAAGRTQLGEQLLKKVLEQRPTSAETHHCIGRAELLDGSNLALALRTLERAVELDPHRAEYHLYVGWAANEAGRVAVAEQALKRALELDQGLGDAYWQRGILRYRQGAVKDAVADLTRALELRPGRYEAHAALADAYFDLGFEAKALEQWRLATHAQPDNATWRYRYGKLLQAAHRDAEARPELEAALELASKLSVMPRWAWEAHHLLARAIGAHPAAVKHWQAFLELAPRDNPYRDEAKQTLAKLGQPWDRD
jgi:cellulose synthase operon protein C